MEIFFVNKGDKYFKSNHTNLYNCLFQNGYENPSKNKNHRMVFLSYHL